MTVFLQSQSVPCGHKVVSCSVVVDSRGKVSEIRKKWGRLGPGGKRVPHDNKRIEQTKKGPDQFQNHKRLWFLEGLTKINFRLVTPIKAS
jgi:hypothetical protein